MEMMQLTLMLKQAMVLNLLLITGCINPWGIQLGLTDSVRCQLPSGTDGTGYWSLTIYALGYEDYTYTFQVREENIAQPKAADQKDIDALQAKVDEAKGLNKVNYTADSWSSMETELTESEELLKK